MAKPLLSTRKLTQIRKLNERAMPSTATIYRRTLTADGNGGKLASYTSIATVICRVRPENRATDRVEGGKPVNPDLFIATLPWDADVIETDRLTFSIMAGVTFEIAGPVGESSYQVGRRLRIKRVR